MEDKHEIECDVVIVGAGVSGLSAAYYLYKKDPTLSITVLEAKDRIGGRTVGMTALTASGSTHTWDLGGQWVGRCQPSITQLLDELGMKNFPQYSSGKKLMQLGSAGNVTTYKNDIPSLPFLSLLDLSLFLYRIERMRKQINTENPGESKYAEQWDGITLEDYMRQHVWTRATSDTLTAACRCVFGADPSYMSFLYFLMYINCAGGMDPIISSREKFGGQELRLQDGAWKICHRLQESMPDVKVLTSHPVASIVQPCDCDSFNSKNSVTKDGRVLVTTLDGSSFSCKHVIMAVPPHLAASLSYSPSLPLSKHFAMRRMPVGYLTKIICTYSKPFWREAGLSGEVVTVGGRPVVEGCSRGPLCVVMDATSFNNHPALVSFIGGEQQLEYGNISMADRRRAVLHSLAEFFGPQALSPVDYIEKNWNEELYNGGCPVSLGTPGMMTKFAPALRNPFNRIHFAGTESATVWCGFINGAVQAGHRAAAEVLHNLRPGLLSETELSGTFYGKKNVSNTSCSCSKVFWSLGVGLVIGGMAGLAWWKLRRGTMDNEYDSLWGSFLKLEHIRF